MLHPTAGTPARPRRMVVFKREMPLYLMLIPGVAFAFVFCYLPMFGLVMAFQNYSPLRSFSGSEWVGLKNFQAMLSLPTFWTVVRNTLMISSVKILLRLLVPLIIALLLNEVLSNGFKRTAQTVFFLPYFLSWAVMGGVLRELFEYDGTINAILQSLGWEPIMFLGSNTWFPMIIIVSDVWKDMGYNMIIFLAAITNVDPEMCIRDSPCPSPRAVLPWCASWTACCAFSGRTAPAALRSPPAACRGPTPPGAPAG